MRATLSHLKKNYILQTYKQFYGEESGGVERHIVRLCNATYISRNTENYFLFKNGPARPASFGLELVPYRSILHTFRMIKCAEICHIHGARSFFSFLIALISSICSTPYIYTPHFYYKGRNYLNSTLKFIWDMSFERFIVAKARCVISLTEYATKEIYRIHKNTSNITVIPNSVDHNKIEIKKETDEDGIINVLSVSRLTKVKRVADLIATVNDPQLKHFELHIVGTGEEERALKALCAKYGLEGRVKFYGLLTDVEVNKLASKCQIFALASEEEGLPTAVLEMLYRGLYVAVSDIPAHLEIYETVGCLKLFKVGELKEIREILLQFNNRYTVINYKKFIREYSWYYNSEKIVKTYTDSIQ